MNIVVAESPYTVPESFYDEMKDVITEAHDEVRRLMPFTSEHINFIIQPREYSLIKETQTAANTVNSTLVTLAFNPTLLDEKAEDFLKETPPSVYHEMSHAGRFELGIWHDTFLDWCLAEGLATAFERDYANAKPLWGNYPDDVTDWLEEIQEQGEAIDQGQYLFHHQDGRKWIGYKVGTYLIDQAVKKSGKSIPELTKLECSELLKLAQA